MKLIVKRHFDAAHHLIDYDGPCSNVHGHTWKVEVTMTVPEPKGTFYLGPVIDFKDLKKTIDELLPDHRDINKEVGFNPTAENLALWIHSRLALTFGLVSMPERLTVRVWESEDCGAEAGG